MRENYGQAIRSGFAYLLENHPEFVVLGQGLWSPWYVGNSMTNLEEEFGRHRVIDTPVSEAACTGAAVGLGLAGMRSVVVHPRMDFALYAMDAIVNQAAKWSSMTGGQASPAVTFRTIINRGGEQGAQHSQALQAWFAHVPGLRVVMPATPADARDLLVASVLSEQPVVYIDDRWLYEEVEELGPIRPIDLTTEGPRTRRAGSDVSLVGAGHSVKLMMEAADELERDGINAEVIDLRVVSPLKSDPIVRSVAATRRLVAVDGGWSHCGLSSEIVATVVEELPAGRLLAPPARVALPFAPAPCSPSLEAAYYPTRDTIIQAARALFKD